ncbi:alpha/beta fold hydrolase [Nocardia brasiliensis]|uniref:alpha/beta fold hydrolase n=1 Tax=Nocardia brasiliensis TaxID=37326 RepID=UPI002454A6AC|nr:alpha/beta hydrolase [Nocardia brasiliensis]
MAEELASKVGPSEIDVAFERLGDPRQPPVLLMMGAAGQLIDWPDGLCAELVERGLHVIRFDSRDTGRSSYLTSGPAPDIAAAMSGDVSSAAYTLSDMAADTVGLLDALGLDSAHLVGASQGAMIAQTIAIEFPSRARSLTSMMSTTGNPDVGRSDPAAFGRAGAPPTERADYIAWRVAANRAVGASAFAFDEAAAIERAGRGFDRGFSAEAMMRQFVAVLASGDRTAQLNSVHVPTVVIHGTEDRAFDLSGGRATAEAIPGAELVIVPGMGHSMSRELWPTLAEHIAGLVHRVERNR